jgi:hypothetical protein
VTEIDAARLNITLGKIQALVRDEKAAGVPVVVTPATMLAHLKYRDWIMARLGWMRGGNRDREEAHAAPRS